MKRLWMLLLSLLLLCSSGCSESGLPEILPVLEEIDTSEIPVHSELYLPEYTVDQVWEAFEEVILHMEYTDGTGNPALVQKWKEPIRYWVRGNPAEGDLAALQELFAQLDGIHGFPGIDKASSEDEASLTLSFLDREAFAETFSMFPDADTANGGVHFWYYTETGEIHTATVGYYQDMADDVRTSVLREEIVNALGVSDSDLRRDSIVYQYSDENDTLSDMDLLILRLLYHPRMECGMDSSACRQVVEELYY